MKKQIYTSIILLLAMNCVISQPSELVTQYGPPAEANTWEKFSIPLTAENFGVDEATFDLALQNITSLWIGTEMHTGNDVGGLDEVMLGDAYFSSFNTSFEGWSSGGDGTMEWVQEGGYDGAYLKISDWSTGEYHFLIAPASWAGDWSALNGQNLEFWYKTSHPSYPADIKLTTETVNRLVMNTPYGNAVAPDDSVLVEMNVSPPPDNDLQVNITTSDNSCINVPAYVMVPQGDTITYVYFYADEEAVSGCISVIEATAVNYLTSRITMNVLEGAGVEQINKPLKISVFPNPCSGSFELSTPGMNAEQLNIYSLTGKQVMTRQLSGKEKESVWLSELPAGIYFMEIKSHSRIAILKLIVE